MKKHLKLGFLSFSRLISIVVLFACAPAAFGHEVSLSLQDIDIREVMKMLSREHRLNIFVAEGVDAHISLNIYDMDSTEAIELIAESAGFVVENRNGSYFVIEREDAGKFRQSEIMQVRSFKVQYTSSSDAESILKEYLSSYGSIKSSQETNLLIIEDMPQFLDKIETILFQIDREPKQIMIEAKILEISLTDNQSFGLNWAKLFDSSSATGTLGTQGLASTTSPGLFAQYNNSNVDLVLSALKERGRLRTISTPKLLAMEGLEAETVVGSNIGFRVTTTVNQVTTETIEFLETGIILKVTPSVDRSGRILLDIHPEVSAGVVSDDGIPSKSTTQVSTRMLVPNGKTVFLGGLIKHSINNTREGVPGLGDLPIIGGLFSNDSKNISSTEIVVLITPRIVDYGTSEAEDREIGRVKSFNQILDDELRVTEQKMDKIMDRKTTPRDIRGDK
jgi:type II secretory pathway component GspD/PulD (secretin)